jgi:hypothetical protein
MLEMFPVASSRISEMGYEADTATVYVRFTKDGKAWEYRNVPRGCACARVSGACTHSRTSLATRSPHLDRHAEPHGKRVEGW